MSIVFDIGHEIRDLVNEPRRQRLLMRDHARWSQVCVCMDVISDTEQAIRGYLAQTTTDHDILYLTTYGVLQAFVAQQDAVFYLASALGHSVDGWEAKQRGKMDWSRHPELLGIRSARIRAAGHPSKTNGDKAAREGYHVIVQHSLQVGHFEMMSWNGADGARVRVDVTKLAADQRDSVGGLLALLRDGLVEDDREHKAKFQGERLADLFKGTGYAFQKIIDALGAKGTDPMAEGGFAVLEQSLEKFRRALDVRERPSASVDWIYSELAFPLARIRQALDERSSSNEDEKRNAYCLAHFVRLRFDELEAIAAELDADYLLVTGASLPAPTSASAPPT